MFIVRTSENVSRLKRWNGMSIDGDAVYEFKADGKYHFLVNTNRFRKIQDLPKHRIESILCEDKESGKCRHSWL